MSDFIRRQSEVQDIPSLLTSRVFGFRESPEYRELRDYELDIPGVVCGAFGRYIARIHEQAAADASGSIPDTAIASSHEVMEALASSPEPAVHSLVTDEIFENLECKPEALKHFEAHLKGNILRLYKRWMRERGI